MEGVDSSGCLILLCSPEGTVERVLRDDFGWVPTATVGRRLDSLPTLEVEGLGTLLGDARASGGAFGGRAALHRASLEAPLHLAISPLGEQFLVVASEHLELLGGLAREGRLAAGEPEGARPDRRERDRMLYDDIVRLTAELASAQRELAKANAELERTIAEVRVMSGLLPVCAWCHRIRDDAGEWTGLETYVRKHSDTEFTHGCCPECLERLTSDEG